jgi:hypothetical protein
MEVLLNFKLKPEKKLQKLNLIKLLNIVKVIHFSLTLIIKLNQASLIQTFLNYKFDDIINIFIIIYVNYYSRKYYFYLFLLKYSLSSN